MLAEIEKTAGLDAKHVQCRWSVYVPSYNNTSKQANAFPLKSSILFKSGISIPVIILKQVKVL